MLSQHPDFPEPVLHGPLRIGSGSTNNAAGQSSFTLHLAAVRIFLQRQGSLAASRLGLSFKTSCRTIAESCMAQLFKVKEELPLLIIQLTDRLYQAIEILYPASSNFDSFEIG